MWNKKEHNIIISRIISSLMGPMYSETPSATDNEQTAFELF